MRIDNMRTTLNIFKSKLPEPMKTIYLDLYSEDKGQRTRHFENKSLNKQSPRKTTKQTK